MEGMNGREGMEGREGMDGRKGTKGRKGRMEGKEGGKEGKGGEINWTPALAPQGHPGNQDRRGASPRRLVQVPMDLPGARTGPPRTGA